MAETDVNPDTLYTQSMEDIRDRRKIEWQTFMVVNAIYGLALRTLWRYTGGITWGSGLVITILFTHHFL